MKNAELEVEARLSGTDLPGLLHSMSRHRFPNGTLLR